MPDNVNVSNAPSSVNPDIPVRSLEKSAKQTQVVAIDFGGSGSENLTVPNFATETTLATLSGKVPTVGQKTMANSAPVVLASDQTAVSVTDGGGSLTVDGTVAATQSGVWSISGITGSITLPSGASTESTLSALNAKVPAQGQATMAASAPVVIASNQSAVPVSDSGGSLTVDGTVAATQSGVWEVNLSESTGATPAFATIGLTSVSIGLAAGTYQKLVFCNTSTGTISLSFNGAAVANRGIVLNRGEKVFIDGPIVVTTINAISNSVGSNLAIQAFT